MDNPSTSPPVSSTRLGAFFRQRRGSRRRELNAEIEVIQPAPGTGVTINESDGGLRIAVDCALRIGELCTLRLSVPGGNSRLETGRVVWSRELRDGWIAGVERIELH